MNKKIFLNSQYIEIPNKPLHYEHILNLAGFPIDSSISVTFSMKDGTQGSLFQHTSVQPQNGMIINVTRTDKA